MRIEYRAFCYYLRLVLLITQFFSEFNYQLFANMNRFRSVIKVGGGSITRQWKRDGRFNKKKSGGTKEIHQCPGCTKKFLSKNSLSKHVVIHSDERPFSCDKCTWAFKRKDLLARHMVRRHLEEGAGGGVQEELVTLETESDQVTVEMEPCEAQPPTGVEGTREIQPRRNLRSAVIPCSVSTPPSMASTSTMSGHDHHHEAVPKKRLTVAAPQPLDVTSQAEAESGVPLSSKSNLTRHLVNNHAYSRKRAGRIKTNFAPKTVVAHSQRGGGGVHKCSKCGNCYTFKTNLTRHFKKAHGQSQEITTRGLASNQKGTRTRPVKKSNSAVIESIVGKSVDHLQSVHGKTKEMAQKLSKKGIRTKSGVSKSAKKASGGAPPQLDVASGPAVPAKNKKITVAAPPAHRCHECRLFFPSKRMLGNHMPIHKVVRPFACRLCVWTFKRRDTLFNHLKRKHGKSEKVARNMVSASGVNVKNSCYNMRERVQPGVIVSTSSIGSGDEKAATTAPIRERRKAPWLSKPEKVPVVDNREVIVVVGQYKFCTPGLLVKPRKRVMQGCATFQEAFWADYQKTIDERNLAPLIQEEPELNMSLSEIAELII